VPNEKKQKSDQVDNGKVVWRRGRETGTFSKGGAKLNHLFMKEPILRLAGNTKVTKRCKHESGAKNLKGNQEGGQTRSNGTGLSRRGQTKNA